MAMLNPPHPGLSVRHDCLEPLELSVTEGAANPPLEGIRRHA
jgi:antitoxin HigA-1